MKALKAMVGAALLVTSVAILLAGPAGAQSYDPDVVSGNIVRRAPIYWARYRAPAWYWAQPRVYWRTYGRVYPRYGRRAYW